MKTKKINLLDKGKEEEPFAFENQLQNRRHTQASDALRRYDQLSVEIPLMKFLSAVKSGNKQDRQRILSEHYKMVNLRRIQKHIRVLSRNRYLEIVRCSLKQTGLLSDRDLRSICLDMLPHSLCATF